MKSFCPYLQNSSQQSSPCMWRHDVITKKTALSNYVNLVNKRTSSQNVLHIAREVIFEWNIYLDKRKKM